MAPALPHLGFGTSYVYIEFIITVSGFSDSCALVVMRLQKIIQGKPVPCCVTDGIGEMQS